MSSKSADTHFRVYSGREPFAFISYAHADRGAVLSVLHRLQEDRLRIWYDGGIQVGTEWPQVVASRLADSGTVVFFLSKSFFKSPNCVREAHYAVSQRKRMICVLLDDAEAPQDLQMQFSVAERLDGRREYGEALSRRLAELLGSQYEGDGITGYETLVEHRKPFPVWRLTALLLAVLVLAGGFAVMHYRNGRFPSAGVSVVTVSEGAEEPLYLTQFKDPLSRSLLLKAYDEPALYLCGNMMVSRGEAIRYTEGSWTVAGQPAEPGEPIDCAELAAHDSLRYLALVNMGMSDLSALSAIKQLVYLDISGNPVEDLSFLRELENVQVLKLIAVEGVDYSVLSEMKNLEYLYISVRQLDAVRECLGLDGVDVIVKG